MKQYLDLLRHVYENGEDRSDRTGTGTRSIFGTQTRYDLNDRFPLLTTKKIYMKGVIHELLWFISGKTNIAYLRDNDVHIWDAWANKEGDLGPIYGQQWRSWTSVDGSVIDQLQQAINDIRFNPDSRRIIVNAWNVGELKDMALPPCHMMFQFYVHGKNSLSMQMYQRSADLFLGVPFNIASYALLLKMVAYVTGRKPAEFIHTIGDAHIYQNHFAQVEEQLSREPKAAPLVGVNPAVFNIDDYTYDHFLIENYDPHPAIKAEVSV